MNADFQRIPLFFLERYSEELLAWAQNFFLDPAKHADEIRKWGCLYRKEKSIVLREGHWAELSPNEEQGAVLIQVKLKAEVVRNGFSTENAKVEVRPATEDDERKIRQHCERMTKLGVPSRLFTKEPERPWLPFMPKIERPN